MPLHCRPLRALFTRFLKNSMSQCKGITSGGSSIHILQVLEVLEFFSGKSDGGNVKHFSTCTPNRAVIRSIADRVMKVR